MTMVDQRCSRRWYLAARVTSLPPTADTWEDQDLLRYPKQVWVPGGTADGYDSRESVRPIGWIPVWLLMPLAQRSASKSLNCM